MAKLPRLKKRKEFISVAQSQVSFKTATLILQMLSRPAHTKDNVELPPVRIGFTASRRVGGAVERNRARRRLREVVNIVVPQFNLGHHDLVLIARTATVNAPFSALLRDLTYAIKQCLKRYDH
jgi:ribonuclease P protein component